MTTKRDIQGELERAAQAASFPVGVYWVDTRGQCRAVNQRWCELSGLSEEESLGTGWMRAVHPDDRGRLGTELLRANSSAENMATELRLVRPDGHVSWVLSQTVVSLAEDGAFDGAVGTITDITESKRTEAALRESEERYRRLVDLSPDFVAIQRDGVMLFVNRAGFRVMAASEPAELIGRHISEFVLPAHRDLVARRMADLEGGSQVGLVEMEVRRCDGQVIWIESSGIPTVYDGEPAVQFVARDITERRRIAEAYRAVVENIREAMWIMERGDDQQWRATFVNTSYLRTSRLESAEPLLHKTLPELVKAGFFSQEESDSAAARYERASQAESPMEYEYRVTWNGLDSHLVTTMTPVRDAKGRCDMLICWSRDLTARRRHEQELAESEANYRAVVEGTSEAVWVMDRGDDGHYRVRLANSRTSRMLGRPIEELVGKTLPEILAPAAAARAEEKYREAELAGHPIEYETRMDRGGVRNEVVTHITPLFDANGRCFRIIGSARDVSDRRRAETALLQAQKLESLGVLAGGIAHDFNNLLTTILGNLFLLESDLPQESQMRSFTGDSRLSAQRGADLVKRLLSFSRPGIEARERVSIAVLFRETGALVRRTLGPGIQLEFLPGPEDDTVDGEFSSLQQVLLNLILNSRDAMPDGGRITVSRRIRTLGEEPIWAQRSLPPGRYHEILVRDAGTGMSRDLVQRIFDPFFTTKGVGKGTGLGLSTALSIVRAHGGWLEAESEEGEGSTFRILLPVVH